MGEITVKVYGEQVTLEEGITLLELAERYQEREKHDIVLAYMNQKLCELHKKVQDGTEIRFLTVAD